MRGPTAQEADSADRRPIDALESVSAPIDDYLERFLRARISELAELDPALEPVGREIADLVRAGGKRLRPAFVYWGHRATGASHDDGVLGPAAAVELLHTFALIHDDIMDRSDERRGRLAVHEGLADLHRREGLDGDPGWFGVGGGILAGDLAFVWADQLFDEAALSAASLDRARTVFARLRVEVMAGQYLDLRLAGSPDAAEDESRRVALLKSGRYTVTRPLQLGAAIAGSDSLLDADLEAYGDAVGIAFQLRDDVLGLFGDPEETGKGALGDLREGKRTVLILRALARADGTGRDVLARALGNPNLDDTDAERVREIVVDCGALASVEAFLATQREAAQQALRRIDGPARGALAQLADLAITRID